MGDILEEGSPAEATSGMNGLEIAQLAANAVARLAPFVAQGIQLGFSLDPTLERQLRSAVDLANQALANADAQIAKDDAAVDARLPPK
jgi:hypothetical protein